MNPSYTEFRFPQIKAHPWHKVCVQSLRKHQVDHNNVSGSALLLISDCKVDDSSCDFILRPNLVM
jgi:hypothetical protein